MIEINLLPGSVKRTKRKSSGGLSKSMPKINMPPIDKYVLFAIGMWVLSLGLIAYMQIGGKSKLADAKNRYQVLQRDTAKYSNDLAVGKQLIAKSDTIALKLKVIQELDAGRFDLAHILDEIARTVPDYTWIVGITPSDGGDAANPVFRIDGRMGNAFALPKFLTDLENSPFIKNVTMKKTAPVVENQKPMYSFIIEAQYEQPSADLVHTVPLFGPGMVIDSATQAAVMAAPSGVGTDPASAAAAANAAAAKAAAGGRPAAPKPAAPGKKPAPAPAKKAGK